MKSLRRFQAQNTKINRLEKSFLPGYTVKCARNENFNLLLQAAQGMVAVIYFIQGVD